MPARAKPQSVSGAAPKVKALVGDLARDPHPNPDALAPKAPPTTLTCCSVRVRPSHATPDMSSEHVSCVEADTLKRVKASKMKSPLAITSRRTR